MKKEFILLLMFSIHAFSSGDLCCQISKPAKKVTITFDWSRIQTYGSNQLAIWIEDAEGNYLKTLLATRFTVTGGFKNRPESLSEWIEKSGFINAPKEEIDAISGSTPLTGKQSITWNCTDKSGNPVMNGEYIIKMEANIQVAKKMYYSGKIFIGGKKKKTSGEVTYSSPELATGNVLFKNVLVEYK